MEKAKINNKKLLLKYLEKLKDIKIYLNNLNDIINLDANLVNKNLNKKINDLYNTNDYKKLINDLEKFGKTNLINIINLKEEIKEIQIIEDDEIIEPIEEPELLEDDPIIIEEDYSHIELNKVPLPTRKQCINGFLYKNTKATNGAILGKVNVIKSTKLIIYDRNGKKLNIKLDEKEYNIYDYTKDEKNKIIEIRITPDEEIDEKWIQL